MTTGGATTTAATTTDGVQRTLGGSVGPVPLWALAALVGAWIGEQVAVVSPTALPGAGASIPGGVVVVTTLVALALAVAMWRRARRDRASGRLPIVVGLVTAVAVALVSGAGTLSRIAAADQGLLPTLADQGGQVTVVASVATEPRPITDGWHVLVRVDEVDGVGTRERAALILEADPPALGERFEATTTAQPLPDSGYGTWLARQHAVVLLDLRGWERLGQAHQLARASEHVRSRVREAATRHLDDRVGGLLVGFVTGDTRLLPPEDREAMEATSLTHLTAVSGTNVGLVIAGVLGVASLLRAGAGTRRLAVALVVPWFAYVTRFEPSVLRAGTMAVLLLLAGLRGHVRDARHSLAVAVLVLLLIDPRLAGSLGLILSATATVGVLVIAPVVRRRLPERLPRRVAELTSITLGAQIAVVPVLLVSFGELSVASIPANLVAVPGAIVAATIAFIGTVLALIHVELGAVAFALASPGSRLVLAAAHGFADVGGVAEVGRPATVVALAAGCVWLVAGRRTGLARGAAAATILALLLSAAPLATGALPRSGFTVTAIDVGQGDAFLIESPGARVLVDAGEDETAARWLRRNGRRSLDLVVVSHPHLDHVGGVPEVLRRIDVGAVWAAPLPTELPQAAEVHEVAADRDVPVRAPLAGDEVAVGDLRVEVLHPPPGRPYRHERSELNDSSYVLRIHLDDQRVLSTGDVEVAAQRDLLEGHGSQLQAELFTVPHHGSATSDPAFLAAIGAQVGVIGVGADNQHGHPHPGILAELDRLDVEVRRTDLEGDVTVRVPAQRPAPVGGGRDRRGPHRPAPVGGGRDRRGPQRPVGSSHGSCAPGDRRRRPAAAARGRSAARRAGRGGPGARGRPLRRQRTRTAAGAADHLAVRRTHLHRAPWRGRPQR